jgi:spermidine synthase
MNGGLYNRATVFVMDGSRRTTLREALAGLGSIIYERDGLTGRIAVRQPGPDRLAFIVNGKPDGSSAVSDLMTEIVSVDLALLCHPRPRKVLLIGLGTGISAGAALVHPEVETLDIAEIEPRQVEVARIFARHNHNALADPRVRVHLDDARHFLLTTRDTYDVIVSEPSNLFVSGMVNLYTVEALELARRRLAPGGILLQWLHYYQIGDTDLLGALATFRTAFPQTTYWVQETGDSYMMGTEAPLAIDLADWERRGRAPALVREYRRAGLTDPLAPLASYRLGPADVARHTRGAPLCRDDFPYLEFTAPRVPWDQLITARHREWLQALPVSAPVPLSRETARSRVRLGRVFLAGAHLARAKLEFARALALDPGSAEAKRGLKRVEAYYGRGPGFQEPSER